MSNVALVVDDSRSIRMLVSKVLKQAGFEVMEAENGKDALAKLTEKSSVQLVITDLNMPVMDGLELIRAIRQDAQHKFTPVVFLTTESEEAKKEEAKSAGATGWIIKPFHPEKVMTVVRRVVT
ncbi:MAG: response regulator [Myxococcales bacterium]|nr:response regulator [Myxococcales bacterium]MCB9579265.1 response regulator [Polyangiaceae bacterium]